MRINHWNRWLWATAVVSALLLAVLLSSQHRIRLVVCSFRFVDSIGPTPQPEGFRFIPDVSFSKAPPFSADVALLQAFDRNYPLMDGDPMPAVGSPDTCIARLKRGVRMHCYDVDIGCTALLAQIGAPARLWNFNGPNELGGDGHNLLEVFDGNSHRWKAIDPYYHCYFTLGDSIPISASELRNVLLKEPGRVHLIRYSDTLGERPDPQIIGELTFLVPGAMLHENNNFYWRYHHRYSWLTSIAAPLFDKLPLREARGVRTIMLGSQDRLIVLDDRFSPHFPFFLTKISFYALLGLFGISVMGLLLRIRITKWHRYD